MRCSTLMLILAGLLPAAFAHATRDTGAYVEVHDLTAGRTLPLYRHEGRLYVAGEPGHQYELRLRNQSNRRLLAVTSVDGVNVITGETASGQQRGYVLDPWGGVDVEGWRKSLDEVATFFFTRLSNSYAARTGRPHDVGVIGVAVFNEQPQRRYQMEDRAESAAAPAPQSNAAGDAETRASAPEAAREKLGTGHGHRESSPAQYVSFQRASNSPSETIVIYYDSKKNLLAQGVIKEQSWFEPRQPNPFPNGFVPDP